MADVRRAGELVGKAIAFGVIVLIVVACAAVIVLAVWGLMQLVNHTVLA